MSGPGHIQNWPPYNTGFNPMSMPSSGQVIPPGSQQTQMNYMQFPAGTGQTQLPSQRQPAQNMVSRPQQRIPLSALQLHIPGNVLMSNLPPTVNAASSGAIHMTENHLPQSLVPPRYGQSVQLSTDAQNKISSTAKRPSRSSQPLTPSPTPSVPTPLAMNRASGFNSPSRGDASQQFYEQCDQLHAHLVTAEPRVLRRCVRELWTTTLKGSNYHHEFIFNYIANTRNSAEWLPPAFARFGKNLSNAVPEEIVNHWNTVTMDQLQDKLIEKMSDAMIDKIVAARFKTIPSRDLLNMLARAERLGYTAEDVLEDDDLLDAGDAADGEGLAAEEPAVNQKPVSDIVHVPDEEQVPDTVPVLNEEHPSDEAGGLAGDEMDDDSLEELDFGVDIVEEDLPPDVEQMDLTMEHVEV